MTMTMSKSHLNDQHKLKVVCDEVCDNIESLLGGFGLDYKYNNKFITMSCPIHGGDNASAFNLYPEGDTYRGNWKCRTHGCEKVFKASVIGFIRGIISHQKYGWIKEGDDQCTFKEAVEYATKFINKDLSSIKISRVDKDKRQFTNVVNYLNNEPAKQKSQIKRQQIIQSLQIPSTYYLNRNYTSDILTKYDVGLCDKPDKEMSDRVVVPIYDNNYEYMIGCTGRSIFEKCDKCKGYHNPSNKCPSSDDIWKFPKWKHSSSFKSQNTLYNFWFAQKHILDSGIVIIVESPGNVWRLEENGIHNSVAMFGSSLSDRQKILLDSSGAMSIVILTDNDEAGRKAAQQIKSKCQNTYRVFIPSISKPDVGEMTSDEINNEIKTYLESLS